jgi:hypothetical protein
VRTHRELISCTPNLVITVNKPPSRNFVTEIDVTVMVTTTMAPRDALIWDGVTKMAIGRALLDSDEAEGPLTAARLAAATGRDQSNLKKAAEELVAAGALRALEPDLATNGRAGRPARTAFAFADGQREQFEEFLDLADRPSDLAEVGTQLVIIDADEGHDTLWKVLSQPGVGSGADRGFQLEGGRSEVMYAFNGPNAVDDSNDFLAILTAAELKAHRHSISKAASPRDFRRTAQRRLERVQRSRERRGAMQTAPNPAP